MKRITLICSAILAMPMKVIQSIHARIVQQSAINTRTAQVVLMAFGLAFGCAAPGQFDDAGEWISDRSMVVGQVRFVIDGKTQGEPSRFGRYHGPYWLILHRAGEERARTYNLQGDCIFFWALEPGTYRIVGIERQAGGGGVQLFGLGIEFAVPEEPANSYLGTFDLVLDEKGYDGFNIVDESGAMERAFYKRFPGHAAALNRIAVSAETEFGDVGTLTSVCSPLWGEVCASALRNPHMKGEGIFSRRGILPKSPTYGRSSTGYVASRTDKPPFRDHVR